MLGKAVKFHEWGYTCYWYPASRAVYIEGIAGVVSTNAYRLNNARHYASGFIQSRLLNTREI